MAKYSASPSKDVTYAKEVRLPGNHWLFFMVIGFVGNARKISLLGRLSASTVVWRSCQSIILEHLLAIIRREPWTGG